jgi:hypothetical protein
VKPEDISEKKKEYLKEKINEIATDSKNKNIRDPYRGINEFKRGCQPRSNLIEDENGDLHAYSHKILSKWKNYSSQLLNVLDVSDVKQIEVHIAEPLVPGPSHLEAEIEIDIAELRKYKSPGSDKVTAELIEARGETLLAEICNLFNSIGNKEELPDQ